MELLHRSDLLGASARRRCLLVSYRPLAQFSLSLRTLYGRNFGAHHCEGPAYHEPQKSIVRCLEYGTRCPQLAESQAAFRRNEIAVSKVPADRRFVLDINRPESMDARALARYLGRPVPAFHAIPISALNFCSYDGVLRGPFGFRLSADELKHPSVRSTDHK